MRSLFCAVPGGVLALLIAGCGGNGSQGPIGPAGAAGPPGANGANGAKLEARGLVGSFKGTVIAAADSRPLPNVSVTLAVPGAVPSDAGGPTTTTSDGAGAFSLANEPIGSYQITFAATGFISKTITVGNSVAGPTILAVTLATDTTTKAGIVGQAAASTTSTPDAPTFQLTVASSNGGSDPYAVGFGTTVTVSVATLADTAAPYDAGAFTYAWKISTAPTTTNPGGSYTFTSAPSSSSATFTTLSLAATKAVEMYPYTSPLPDGGAMGYIGRLGVLGINPDETGNYGVALTVTDPEGHFYTFSQTIRSTWQTPSIANVGVGNPVYLQGDTFAAPNWLEPGPSVWKWPNTSWTWTVTKVPTGSAVTTATLGDANTQYPHFVPDAVGEYDLQVVETSTAVTPGTGPGWDGGTYGTQTATVVVYAGTYEGVMNTQNSVCSACHSASADTFFTPALGQIQTTGGLAPDFFTPWKGTAHASALQRKMDGFAGNHFGESCLQCHTLGWSNVATADNNALNGGFTYEMTQPGTDGGTWSWPASITAADGGPMVPGAYEALVSNFPKLAPLAGIQCENCHGPAGGPANSGHPGSHALYGARVDWSSQLCASCHEERNGHYEPSQWGPSNHGNVEVAIQRATVEGRAATYGGGNDPQSGAQFCARCHSAQGFVQYVRLLQNGATGRYDFITTDDKKLSASNAPTTAYLSSIGLNAAQVQPQTCVSCHDPHSNGAYGAAGVDCSQAANYGSVACMQLRVYDSLPGLPSGQGAISGVGAGAICMTCHNGRNGEHTDVVDTSPYAETPHDSTATEALFGYNAYFVSEYNPSPHLAIQDTCVGCHVKLPTAAETAAGQSINHGFSTDLSICQNCHGSGGVDGVALQAQVAADLANLSTAIVNKEVADITALSTTYGLCVRTSVSNPACTGGSCASSQVPTAVPFPLAPSTVWVPAGDVASVSLSSHGAVGPSDNVTLKLTTPVSFDYFDPEQQITTSMGTTSLSSLSVAISTIQVGVPGTGASNSPSCGMTLAAPFAGNMQTVAGIGPTGGYVYLPSTVTAKAVWNFTLLSNEGSGGIHNFPWTNAVINATNEAVANANKVGAY